MHRLLIGMALLNGNVSWAGLENASAYFGKAHRPAAQNWNINIQVRIFSPSFYLIQNYGSKAHPAGTTINYDGINENYGPAINYGGINHNHRRP